MSEESGLAEQRHFLSLAKSCRNISSEVRDAVVASRMVARFNCAISNGDLEICVLGCDGIVRAFVFPCHKDGRMGRCVRREAPRHSADALAKVDRAPLGKPLRRYHRRSSSGCTQRYGVISRVSVSLIMCTSGAYLSFRHDRHLKEASRSACCADAGSHQAGVHSTPSHPYPPVRHCAMVGEG
jgi:hypothetical protein